MTWRTQCADICCWVLLLFRPLLSSSCALFAPHPPLCSFALPIWAVSAAALPLQLLPSQRAQQRQQAEAQLPQEYAGWQHEMLNVNGIRLHAVSPGRCVFVSAVAVVLLLLGLLQGLRVVLVLLSYAGRTVPASATSL